MGFRAVVADCFYGDHLEFRGALAAADLPYVLAIKPASGTWAPIEAVHSPAEAVQQLQWGGPEDPGAWTPIKRRFRDGHTETWWAVELAYGPFGPDKPTRAIVATTDPATRPARTSWYLLTNLPHPASPLRTEWPIPPADLAEVVRLYSLRNWVEQGYRQVKQELGWADCMVRSARAIRRHWLLVCCAFSFCWRDWFANTVSPAPVAGATRAEPPTAEVGEKGRASAHLACDAPAGPRLADALGLPPALLARLVAGPAPIGASGAPRRRRPGAPARPLPPPVTNYR